MGGDFAIVPHLFREVNPSNDFRALLELKQMLTKEKKKDSGTPIIVHTHSSKAGILGRMASNDAFKHDFDSEPFLAITKALFDQFPDGESQSQNVKVALKKLSVN